MSIMCFFLHMLSRFFKFPVRLAKKLTFRWHVFKKPTSSTGLLVCMLYLLFYSILSRSLNLIYDFFTIPVMEHRSMGNLTCQSCQPPNCDHTKLCHKAIRCYTAHVRDTDGYESKSKGM